MKYVTLKGGAMLAGTANMLGLHGIDTSDTAIARGMEAPYLLLEEDGVYMTGAGLCRPKYLNYYLNPRGFHMSEVKLRRNEVGAFLRKQRTAMLRLNLTSGVRHPVVYCGYADKKYVFINPKPKYSTEPDTLFFSSPMLKSRLDEEVTLYLLEECPPTPVDFKALLLRSLDTLPKYMNDLLAAREKVVTLEELNELHRTIFRPLMADMLPMSDLIHDDILKAELQLLEHDYRHVFIGEVQQKIALYERLPRKSMRLCLHWLYEDILDRLYEIGASEETMDEHANFPER